MHLLSREYQIKEAKENYMAKFSSQLSKAERSSVRDFYKFYNDQYDQASAMFIRQGALSSADVSVFFKDNDLISMYMEMYSKIGLDFAAWYYKNADKLLEKGSDINNLMTIWQKSFAFVGQQVGAQRVTLVSGTAKKTLISVTKKLMSDPLFMNQGEKVKAKMLKTQFNKYSTYQAKRLVRTEATNAANYATIVSAQTIFDGKDLMKRWHTSIDGRERASHGEVNGQIVPKAGKFSVQGQFLQWPGDPVGSSSNVINCRCGVSVFPKPNAQTTGENITDIGFGVAQATVQSAITEALLISPEVLAPVAEALIDDLFNAKTMREAKAKAVEIFESNGVTIKNISVSSEMGVQKMNKLNAQLNGLVNEYSIDRPYNTNTRVILKYKSTAIDYGYVATRGGALDTINFGDATDLLLDRKKIIERFQKTFIQRAKSAVDEINRDVATITHEFAHVISTRHTLVSKYSSYTEEYYSELKKIQDKYLDEMQQFKKYNNYSGYNMHNLGKYSATNIDEFMAEGFTEYKLSSSPSKYAVEIGKLIDKYFKK